MPDPRRSAQGGRNRSALASHPILTVQPFQIGRCRFESCLLSYHEPLPAPPPAQLKATGPYGFLVGTGPTQSGRDVNFRQPLSDYPNECRFEKKAMRAADQGPPTGKERRRGRKRGGELTGRRVVALACVLVFGFCYAASAQGDASRIDRLMELSDVSGSMTFLLNHAKRFVAGSISDAGFPRDKAESLQAILEELLAPSEFVAAIRAEAQSALTPDELDRLIAWHESELGGRFLAAKAEARQKQDELAELLETRAFELDAERMAIGRELRDVKGDGEFAVVHTMNVISMDAASRWPFDHPCTVLPLGLFRAVLALDEPNLRAYGDEIAPAVFALTYRDFDLAELEQYLAFNSTPASMKYTEAFIRAYDQAFGRAIESMAERSAELFWDGRCGD